MASGTPPIPSVKPKCPECDTELVLVNNELPDKCAKCGFVLDGWESFFRWHKLAQKKLKEGEQPPSPPNPPKKKKGVFSSLSRRRS